MHSKSFGLAVAIAAAAGTAHADDIQVWTTAGVSLFPIKRLELLIEPQIRFDENVSRFAAFLFEAGLKYRIVKWLRVGAAYRSEYERDGSGDLVLRHRVHCDAAARLDLDPIRLGYRLRLQEQIRPSSRDQYRAFLRNLLEVSYRRWKPWTPEVSGELFLGLDDFDDIELDKVRVTASVSYEIQEPQALEVFYRVELPLGDSMDPILHIFGLTYHYDFML